MARKLRIEYPGAIYHVMTRGDHREDIFRDDEDRRRFLSTLGEACVKTDWRAHAYCLMANHFHMVVEKGKRDDYSIDSAAITDGQRQHLAEPITRYG